MHQDAKRRFGIGWPRTVAAAGSSILSAENLAAFSATALKNQTTVLGSHASTETVGALALDYAGLESTFHRLILVVRQYAKVGAKCTATRNGLQAFSALGIESEVIHTRESL